MRMTLVGVLNGITTAMGIVAVATVMLLALPILYDVALRTAGHPTVWGFEVTLYALMIGGFLANGYALRAGYHFRVKALLQFFPRGRRALNRFALAVTFGFGLLVAWSGALLVLYSYTHDVRAPTLLNTPLYLPQLVIPLGGLALALQALVFLITGTAPGEGEDERA